METKWQLTWNYYGWKKYLSITTERDTMQKDWNSTLLSVINDIASRIKQADAEAEIGVKAHSSMYDKIIKDLPFTKVSLGVTYVGVIYPLTLDNTLPEDKIYLYQRGDVSNIGEILIDYLSVVTE